MILLARSACGALHLDHVTTKDDETGSNTMREALRSNLTRRLIVSDPKFISAESGWNRTMELPFPIVAAIIVAILVVAESTSRYTSY